MKKSVTVVAAALALGIILSGCGQAKNGSGGSTSATGKSGAAVRHIEVVTVTTNVPFAFLNENGQYDGYEIAALREIFKRLPQYTYNISGLDFAAMPVALEAGNAQIAICMLVQSDARKARFIFPKEYTTLSPINLVTRAADTNINSLLDLAGKSTITIPAGYEHTMLVNWNAAHPGKEITLKVFNDASSADNYNAILRGDADSVLSYPQGFAIISKELGVTDRLRITPPALVEDTYYMLAKQETQLRDDLDGVIKELKADGTLGKLSIQYLGEDIFEKYTAQFVAQGAVPQ